MRQLRLTPLYSSAASEVYKRPRVLYAWLGPGSFVGGMLIALGLGGTGSEVVGYLLGLGIVVLAIFALGLLVQTRLRGGLARAFNSVMQRIPLVRNVYDLIRKFVDLVAQRDAPGASSISCPLYPFYPPHENRGV